ncbi:SH3 domain-containing protein [Staphylococcus delphini]|uniref:SH3 domain-containing protein n=1 Tax=Staphylococcus delphini TaxID=53344 RepID=UPI003364F5F1
MGYKIVNMWTPSYLYPYKAPYYMQPNKLAIHNTGNTATARNEVAYMNGNRNYVSYHVAVDDKEVVQAIPFNRNAFHTGDGIGLNSGNRTAIGIEICYSMDNGYSGAKSERYKQAEDNAALYAAHVLHQYGWGIDRMYQHYWYSGKDCPHKMRATGTWEEFENKVQHYLNKIKSGKTPSKPKAKSKTSKVGEWKRNEYGTLYKKEKFRFTANSDIIARLEGPFRSCPVGYTFKKGGYVDYDELMLQDGHVWIGYTYKGKRYYLPIRTWDAKTGKVGELWGQIK